MTIMPLSAARPDATRVPACTHDVTRPGVAPRVAAAAITGQRHGAHSIGPMDQPPLDLVTDTPDPIDAESRPWITEQVLALVTQGRVWIDNRNRRWLYISGDTPAARMPDKQQRALATLYAQGLITIDRTRVDMPAPDCRTLRVRRYQPTAHGTELHTRWAALSTYTA